MLSNTPKGFHKSSRGMELSRNPPEDGKRSEPLPLATKEEGEGVGLRCHRAKLTLTADPEWTKV